jgi:hypothetical protein
LIGIQNSTFDTLRTYERAFLKIMEIKDQYQAERIKKGLTGIHEIMKNTTSYFKDMDSLIEIVYKLA